MLLTKTAGKPYAGKPHVRFDEGAGGSNAPPALLYRNLRLKIPVFESQNHKPKTRNYQPTAIPLQPGQYTASHQKPHAIMNLSSPMAPLAM
jgi:hypothetical protein